MTISLYQRARFDQVLLFALLLSITSIAFADTSSKVTTLTIKNQAFEPQSLIIPADVAVKILLKNEDVLPAEFESNDLGKEKVIPGGTTLPLYLEALKPGKYKFFNDFHPSSSGTIIVEPNK